jgi:hypothetical protein
MRRFFSSPAGLMLWLAPVLAQLLTGAKPPGEFLWPPAFFLAVIVYGCGALLCHDFACRAQAAAEDKPFWPLLMRYAVGYGLFVEGVMLGNVTSTDWPRLGSLADPQHGHLLAYNPTWTLLALTTFAVLGVAVPVMMVELLRPEAVGKEWLSRTGMRWARFLFDATVVIGVLSSGRHWMVPDWLVLLLAWWLVRGARNWRPRAVVGRRPWREASPRRVGWGAAGLALLMAAWPVWAPGVTPFSFFRPFVVMVFTAWLTWFAAVRTARRVAAGWSPRHSLAFVTGFLAVHALLAPGQDADAYFTEHPGGMGLVGLLALIGLWRLHVKVRRRAAPPPESDPIGTGAPL